MIVPQAKQGYIVQMVRTLFFVLCLGFGCRSAEDTGALDDTGPAEDTGLPTDTWPPYAETPSWYSEDPCYATGGAWADISGDGRLDWVTSCGNDMAQGPVQVYEVNTKGQLPVLATWASETSAYYGHLATGDVDGDGWEDVVVSVFLGEDRFSSPGTVHLYRNLGGVLETQPSWTSEERFFSFSLALGDIDNDGDLDLSVATGESYYNEPSPDRLYENINGAFSSESIWVSNEATHSFDTAFVDVDMDGWLDLAFAREGSPHSVYFNDGGQLDDIAGWTSDGQDSGGNTLDFGDMNNDGWPDLLISDNGQHGGRASSSVYCGPALNRCWENIDYEEGYPSANAFVDADGDGDLDIALGGWWETVRLYENSDGAVENTPSFVSEPTPVAETITFHDIDGSAEVEITFEGEGPLLAIPFGCRVTATTPTDAAIGHRYITAANTTSIEGKCMWSGSPDLTLTDWANGDGNTVYANLGPN